MSAGGTWSTWHCLLEGCPVVMSNCVVPYMQTLQIMAGSAHQRTLPIVSQVGVFALQTNNLMQVCCLAYGHTYSILCVW